MSANYQYIPRSDYNPTPMDLMIQKEYCKELIAQLREIYDYTDEQIYDTITETADLSDFEMQFLADELGM